MCLGAVRKGLVEVLESDLMEWLGGHGLDSSGRGVVGDLNDDLDRVGWDVDRENWPANVWGGEWLESWRRLVADGVTPLLTRCGKVPMKGRTLT